MAKPKLLGLRTENPEVKLMAAFGGFDSSVYSHIASQNHTRNNLARNTVAFLESNKLDGVDINWQSPSDMDKETFVLLLIEIRRQLTASGYI